MKALNLGCGRRYCPEWVNIDFSAHSEKVISYDLSVGIPFDDNSFDVVYHSHLLEHFSKDKAHMLVQECFRVLRPKGIFRVVVPDLESIAHLYLTALEKANFGDCEWAENYNWMLLELLDQLVRIQSGGEMQTYLKQKALQNSDFVIQRLGVEAKNLMTIMGEETLNHSNVSNAIFPNLSVFIDSAIKPIYRLIRHSNYRRNALLRLILGFRDYQALQIGRFRQSGEVHQWMYDHYSLSHLLKRCGFIEVVQRTALTSYIPNWSAYNLDTDPDGSVYKPDSLFIEGVKPVP
ncbi:class I SAM-dependent methyltransferase [Nodosilinea nodulosa]|uniref:class I SAM-dependent methyltransferase n=1 Tax=Nodosilinea nodulosa TaxID=416001 RepID=UPI000474D671|nr:methyltransferase domain-containing protein [Nodosilinea nodulosa]